MMAPTREAELLLMVDALKLALAGYVGLGQGRCIIDSLLLTEGRAALELQPDAWTAATKEAMQHVETLRWMRRGVQEVDATPGTAPHLMRRRELAALDHALGLLEPDPATPATTPGG